MELSVSANIPYLISFRVKVVLLPLIIQGVFFYLGRKVIRREIGEVGWAGGSKFVILVASRF
jgi:Na+/phosphate symporter